MTRSIWLFAALALSAVLVAVDRYAVANYLYWKNPWIDLPIHFLGGVTIAVLGIGMLEKYRPLLFLLGVASVSIGWEIFEYLLPLSREANYVFDTALDLLMDACGAITVYSIARLTIWKARSA